MSDFNAESKGTVGRSDTADGEKLKNDKKYTDEKYADHNFCNDNFRIVFL